MMELPVEFCERMQKLLGDEVAEFMSSYEEERAYGLRYNPLKFKSGQEFEKKVQENTGFELKTVPWCGEGYYYQPHQQPGKHPWHEGGAYYIQEPSAMSAVELLGVKPGEKVCDLCAAPGGKTTQIAGKMQGQGLLVSNEFYGNRAKILSQNVERMGVANCVVLNEDTSHLSRVFEEFFDKILVDAPCSGEGMFRKEAEALSQWSSQNVEICAKRQQQILGHAAKMLKPGGVLVYSTCTFAPQENEQCIDKFLRSNPDFSLVQNELAEREFSHARGEWLEEKGSIESTLRDNKNREEEIEKSYRLWPHKLKGEGHYVACMVKSPIYVQENMQGNHRRMGNDVKTNVKEGDLKDFREFEKNFLKVRLDEKIDGTYMLFGEQLYLVPREMPDLKGLKVERAGLHLGTNKKNRFEPSHALALYFNEQDVKQTVSCKEPLKYLHGETISCEDGQKGWTLVCVDGISIGWGKAQNGIVKNHYPRGLRICY